MVTTPVYIKSLQSIFLYGFSFLTVNKQMFPPAHITSHKPMFQIFWNNDTRFKELTEAISFSLPFQTPVVCEYTNINIYKISIYIYIHTYTFVLQSFLTCRGVGRSCLRKTALPRSWNMTHKVNKGKPWAQWLLLWITSLINGGVNHRKTVQGAQTKNSHSFLKGFSR